MLPASPDPASHALGLCPQACALDLPWGGDCPVVSIPATPLPADPLCTLNALAPMALTDLVLQGPPEAQFQLDPTLPGGYSGQLALGTFLRRT